MVKQLLRMYSMSLISSRWRVTEVWIIYLHQWGYNSYNLHVWVTLKLELSAGPGERQTKPALSADWTPHLWTGRRNCPTCKKWVNCRGKTRYQQIAFLTHPGPSFWRGQVTSAGLTVRQVLGCTVVAPACLVLISTPAGAASSCAITASPENRPPIVVKPVGMQSCK